MFDNIESQYGIEFPLVDLFHWGQDKEASEHILTAAHVGASKINGQPTDQYILVQDGLDWQIWIAQGDAPLPVRYVITTTDIASRPQYRVDLTWEAGKQTEKSAFTFTPQDGSLPITIVANDDAQGTK